MKEGKVLEFKKMSFYLGKANNKYAKKKSNIKKMNRAAAQRQPH